MNLLFTISGSSGSGKTTLLELLSRDLSINISVSHTTREPRSNEINGVDYFFVSQKQFEKLIEEKAFLEYANVFKNLYGSTKEQVIKNLENGDNVIFDIDWQGAQQIKNQVLNFELVTFFILPPSKKVLLQRLITRDENKDEIIQMRMKQFDKDVLHWIDYDFVVINEDLNKCYNEIIGYLNKTIKYDKEKIKKHIDTLI